MKVLHYSIGVPPFRAGGLPRYTLDIANAEAHQGHQVFILYPEGIDYKYPTYHIVKGNQLGGLQLFKLKNPTLVPILFGVSKPDLLMRESDQDLKEVQAFIKRIKPDVVHFHSIMGISLAVVSEIKRMGIRIVLTTHDFYGLCLKGNFITKDGCLCDERQLYKCALCNYGAPNWIKLRAVSEPLLKPIIRRLQKKSSITYNQNRDVPPKISKPVLDSYKALLNYYEDIFQEMDIIHFNSTQTSEQYLRYIKLNNYVIIPVTDSFVSDRRELKEYRDNKVLKLGYIGVLKQYKGFPVLKKVLGELGGDNWELNVWGNHVGYDEELKGIHYRGMYNNETISHVFHEMDLLVVPSVWHETFSLVTLEALSFGTPVLVSKNVGAKDIVVQYDNTFVYDSPEELKELLAVLLNNKDRLMKYNKRINEQPFPYTMQNHTSEIITQLYL